MSPSGPANTPMAQPRAPPPSDAALREADSPESTQTVRRRFSRCKAVSPAEWTRRRQRLCAVERRSSCLTFREGPFRWTNTEQKSSRVKLPLLGCDSDGKRYRPRRNQGRLKQAGGAENAERTKRYYIQLNALILVGVSFIFSKGTSDAMNRLQIHPCRFFGTCHLRNHLSSVHSTQAQHSSGSPWARATVNATPPVHGSRFVVRSQYRKEEDQQRLMYRTGCRRTVNGRS